MVVLAVSVYCAGCAPLESSFPRETGPADCPAGCPGIARPPKLSVILARAIFQIAPEIQRSEGVRIGALPRNRITKIFSKTPH